MLLKIVIVLLFYKIYTHILKILKTFNLLKLKNIITKKSIKTELVATLKINYHTL